MKYISKGKEPRSLTQYRSTPSATYDGYAEKEDLREALLEQQGYICCYCMQRISNESIKIEHWKSQSKHPHLQLSYKNLLGSCKGNQGQPRRLEHCDTSKKDQEITISPLSKTCEKQILYGGDGTIYSNDKTVDYELNEILNLNLQTLKDNRKVVIENAIKVLKKEFPTGNWTKPYLEKQISKLSSLKSGKYDKYCQAAIYYIQKKLKTLK